MKYLLSFALLASLLLAAVPIQAADPCDPAKVITQANALKSSGDEQKDIAALIELSRAIQNEASDCREPMTQFPASPADTGTRKNPIPFGTQATINRDFNGVETEIRVTITNVLRGKPAFDIIKEANSEPPTGFEYLLVTVNLQYIKGDEDKTVDFTNYIFSSVSKNKKLDTPIIVLFEAGFGEEVYPDSEISGYGGYLVDIDETKPTLMLETLGFSGYFDPPIYFAAYE